MAGAGDKRRIAENAAHLQRLRLLVGGTNALYVLVRLILRRATAGGLLWAGFGLTSLLYAACYKSIAGALAPVYGERGELIFAGQDLSLGGALSYFHDIVYICLFVQLLGCWTDKAWWAFALIPAFAGYMLCVHVVIPWWQNPKFNDMPETEIERKRREKRERQEARAAKFRR